MRILAPVPTSDVAHEGGVTFVPPNLSNFYTLSPQIHTVAYTQTHTERAHADLFTRLDKKKKKKNTHTRRLIFCVANKSQRVFCFVYCLRGGDRGAVMTEYVLACTRTFRTITPVCSYSPCPSAPRRAAVTLPRLSTRRQPEELKPRTWHLVCSTTAAEELLSKCTRSDVKYTRTFTSLVFAKAREGVSFAWLKGLVRRFFFFFFFNIRDALPFTS